MNIITAIKDERLFRPYLGNLATWKPWMTALRCVYGLPVQTDASRKLIKLCTGRDADLMPEDGFDTTLFLTGRRSGKSRTAAILGAYEAALSGRESRLSKGEQGIVAIISPTKRQSRIVHGYLQSVFDTPVLRQEVCGRTASGFDLRNGVRVEIMAGDWRTIRGYTLLAAIIDEVCFFGLDSECKVRSDSELCRAITPSLATCGGRLVAISSPYAKKGWAFNQWRRCFGNDKAGTLVWNCASRVMNETLPQRIVDEALAEDYAAAQAEYLGLWRDDVGLFIPREVVEQLVVPGRISLEPRQGTRYMAAVDVSGGRHDSSVMGIFHKQDGKVVMDELVRWKAPHDPQRVIADFADHLRRFGLRQATGDNFSAGFVEGAFRSHAITYNRSDLCKNEHYQNLIGRLCSGEVELLDSEVLVSELASLERRTRSGGRDIIDHPPGGHDDCANVLAIGADLICRRRIRIGAL